MAAPSITVVKASTNTTITNWPVGVVKANNSSTVLSIQIWNNRGGSTDLADIRDASITSLDTDGGNSSDPVANKWLHVNVPQMDGASSWTGVGGTTTKFIRGDTVTASEGNIIKGTHNDGNATTTASKANYTTVNLRVDVPVNATPNTYNFKTRINGYYVG
jgi:hypothetical protein